MLCQQIRTPHPFVTHNQSDNEAPPPESCYAHVETMIQSLPMYLCVIVLLQWLVFSMQAGQLERRYWYPPGTSKQHRSCTTKVQCPHHIPLAQLKKAYGEFNTDEVPRLVTVAALSHDSSNDSATQATQADQPSVPQHRQMPAPGLSESGVHISASAAAVTGMPPPAYAAQTDGPIRPSVLSAQAGAAPSGLDEPTSLSHQAAEGLQERGDKRDRAASPSSDAAPAKKAKPGKVQLASFCCPCSRGNCTHA